MLLRSRRDDTLRGKLIICEPDLVQFFAQICADGAKFGAVFGDSELNLTSSNLSATATQAAAIQTAAGVTQINANFREICEFDAVDMHSLFAALAYDAASDRLAVISDDAVLVAEAASGRICARLECERPTAVEFSPDGRRLIASGAKARIFEL